jgi:hypothetical protein
VVEPPLATITGTLKDLLLTFPPESVAEITKGLAAADGVPLISPVDEFKESPVGSAPDAIEYEIAPPFGSVAWIVVE